MRLKWLSWLMRLERFLWLMRLKRLSWLMRLERFLWLMRREGLLREGLLWLRRWRSGARDTRTSRRWRRRW